MTEINPYTRAMGTCLEKLNRPFGEAAQDCSIVQFLTNMVQGRMLDHLVHRISQYYRINDLDFEKELTIILVELFSDELFARFRRKVEEKPVLVFHIAQRIHDVENNQEFKEAPNERRSNRLYLNILRHYLQYQNIDEVIETLNSNFQIQQLIYSALLKKYLVWRLSFPRQHPL